VAELEALGKRCGEPLLLIDAHHGADLGGDLDRLLLEHRLPAHQPDQHAVRVAYRIDRVMALEYRFHRLIERRLGPEGEHPAQHQRFELRVIRREQQVAHGDEAAQLAGPVDHVAVGDERDLDQRPQLLDGLGDRHRGVEHGVYRLHEPADAAPWVYLVAFQLMRDLGRNRVQHSVLKPARQLGQDVLRQAGIELEQHRGNGRRGMLREQHRGILGRARLDVGNDRP
jgi:hypothetical protein